MKHRKLETTPEISRRMAKVRLKRGKAETALARQLWREGFRYRLNDRTLPGSPDIAVLRYRLAVFVDGEFWHGYRWNERKARLRANRDYWIEKIEENRARDARNDRRLLELGWTPVHFWEREVRRDLPGCVRTVESLALQKRIDALPDAAFRAPED